MRSTVCADSLGLLRSRPGQRKDLRHILHHMLRISCHLGVVFEVVIAIRQ